MTKKAGIPFSVAGKISPLVVSRRRRTLTASNSKKKFEPPSIVK
jgi:hypothetical protein